MGKRAAAAPSPTTRRLKVRPMTVEPKCPEWVRRPPATQTEAPPDSSLRGASHLLSVPPKCRFRRRARRPVLMPTASTPATPGRAATRATSWSRTPAMSGVGRPKRCRSARGSAARSPKTHGWESLHREILFEAAMLIAPPIRGLRHTGDADMSAGTVSVLRTTRLAMPDGPALSQDRSTPDRPPKPRHDSRGPPLHAAGLSAASLPARARGAALIGVFHPLPRFPSSDATAAGRSDSYRSAF